MRRCWNSLADNREAIRSDLHIFLDGAKGKEDEDQVARTRQEAKKIKGFCKVCIHSSESNRGLSKSILAGIQYINTISSSWIVVEDDLELSKYFLEFINDGLQCYLDEPAVASIHGYVYPTAKKLPDTYFLKGADCWGWGSWNRAWKVFEADGRRLLSSLQNHPELKKFTFKGNAPFLGMLKDQIEGKNDSWAIRWYASTFLAGMYTLYPGKSLVRNIGLDSTGTHCDTNNTYEVRLAEKKIFVSRMPIMENPLGREAFEIFFRERRLTNNKNPFSWFLRGK